MKYIVGIDLGGTKINVGVADESGRLLYNEIVKTEAFLGTAHIVNKILETVDKVIDKANVKRKDIKNIVVGSPGIINSKEKIIENATLLPFSNFDIGKPISERYQRPVYLYNDAYLAMLAEYVFGALNKVQTGIFITLSTGIGSCAIINGKVCEKPIELGHTIVKVNGKKCNCGSRGCLETIASGSAMGKIAENKVRLLKNSALKKYGKISAKEIIDEAKKGDEVSMSIISEAVTYLGVSISNLITIINPEVIVIGGGMSQGWFWEKVKEAVFHNEFVNQFYSETQIVPSSIGVNMGVLGAIAKGMQIDSEK